VTDKPHRGRIKDWVFIRPRGSRHEIVVGKFLDHPTVGKHGGYSATSDIVARDGSEIETRNSRYTLSGPSLDNPTLLYAFKEIFRAG